MDEKAVEMRMQSSLDIFSEEISSIRTGRANPALIEGITVEVYGGQQKMTLRELGSISVPEARMLTFQPWDTSIINEIKNSIIKQNLGLSPVVDGTIIRISLPALTTEQREEYVKILSRKAEESKVKIRDTRSDVRRDLIDQEKKGKISEDELHDLENKLQKITDDYIQKLEEMQKKKEEEILSV
jgi:ribosome recycling factor